jgi:hypothetical protein
VVAALVQKNDGQIFLKPNKDYQMSAPGCLISQSVQATTDSTANYHFVGKILEMELKDRRGNTESLTLNVKQQALAITGQKLVVEEVTDEYGLYRVNASGAEFAVRK